MEYAFDEPAGRQPDQLRRCWSAAMPAPIDPAANYLVVSNNYVRQGGDGFSVLSMRRRPMTRPGSGGCGGRFIAANAPYTPYLTGGSRRSSRLRRKVRPRYQRMARQEKTRRGPRSGRASLWSAAFGRDRRPACTDPMPRWAFPAACPACGDAAAGLVEDQRHPQRVGDMAGDLEQARVLAAEMHRQGGDAGQGGQPAGEGMPERSAARQQRPVEVAILPAGKIATTLPARNSAARRRVSPVRARGGRVGEIDGQEMGSTRHLAQQAVGRSARRRAAPCPTGRAPARPRCRRDGSPPAEARSRERRPRGLTLDPDRGPEAAAPLEGVLTGTFAPGGPAGIETSSRARPDTRSTARISPRRNGDWPGANSEADRRRVGRKDKRLVIIPASGRWTWPIADAACKGAETAG